MSDRPYDLNKARSAISALVNGAGSGKGANGAVNFRPSPQQVEAFVAKHFEYRPRKNGKELRICNPFDDDDSFKFNINVDRAVTHCWTGDEWAGPPNPRTGKRNTGFIHFVQLYLNCTYRQAIQAILDAHPSHPDLSGLSGLSGVTDVSGGHRLRQIEPDARETPEKPLVTMPEGSEPLATTSQKKLGRILSRWLASRGVSAGDIERYKIHHYVTSVIWPYYEYDVLVYWQLRSRMDKRFLFPDEKTFGVTKGQFLYNFDEIEPGGELVVTESIFGCFAIRHQCTATGGAGITDHQVRKMRLLSPRDGVILSPDNDTAGLKSILQNGVKLRNAGFDVYYSIPPRLRYTDNNIGGGSELVTKDWGEIGQLLGFSRVPEIVRQNVKPLDATGRVEINKQIAILASLKHPT